MEKLNVGCGQFKKNGYVNLDVSPASQADVLHDLEVFPYPFEDNRFTLIEADHVLEHLSHPFRVMAEFSRITKPGGIIHIRVPHFSRGLSHPEHKRGFDMTFPFYFQQDFQGGYTGIHLVHKKTRFHWLAQVPLLRTLLPLWSLYPLMGLGALLDMLANAAPALCSRIWCFWVGGFQEIEFVFEIPQE